jgi:hypothetical protein
VYQILLGISEAAEATGQIGNDEPMRSSCRCPVPFPANSQPQVSFVTLGAGLLLVGTTALL